MAEFKMLDDLPKGKPHSYETIMKAMAVLHKMLLKQSEAYGGPNSKYIPAGIAEQTSLLKSFEGVVLSEPDADSEVDRLLDVAHNHADKLATHLEKVKDKEGMHMLGALLKMLGTAMKAARS